MFELTRREYQDFLRCQFGTLISKSRTVTSKDKRGKGER